MGTFAEKSLDLPEGRPEPGVLRTDGGRALKLLEPAARISQFGLNRIPSPDSLPGWFAPDGEDAAIRGVSPHRPSFPLDLVQGAI